jgi:transposase InsO family protein
MSTSRIAAGMARQGPTRLCRSPPTGSTEKFVPERPNQIRLADITYVPTKNGRLYLAVVLDRMNALRFVSISCFVPT